ncbi:MAG: M13 family peptidase [Oscillospiraceae bacterium]|nr:M13 family peptidase [Oscillospiraceae bacterium]
MRQSPRARFFTLFFAILLLIQPVAQASVRLEDDFYEAVNAHWLAHTDLAPHRPSVSGFCELSAAVNHQLRMDFDTMDVAEGALGQFLIYYAMAADYDTRDIQGVAPLLPYIEQIQALESLDQLNAELDQWVLGSMALPFSLQVSSDMGNAGRQALYVSAPGLFLPDVSYYSDPVGHDLLAVLAETGHALLERVGVSNALEVVADALSFDAMLLPSAKTAEEFGAYANLYNPISMEHFDLQTGVLDFTQLTRQLLGVVPDEIVVMDLQYFEAFDELISEEQFQLLKHWMIFNTVFNLSAYLDQDFLSTANRYRMALTGQTEPQDPAELAYLLATGIYGGVVGDYYGRTYFGEEARTAVETMAACLVEAFKQRLEENDWLSPSTIAAAIAKLDALTIQIGYPDEVDPIYSRFVVTEPTLLENTMAFAQVVREENFSSYSKPVDRNTWGISAHTVNAQYNPITGAITFPAAILQAPFYCPTQSESTNYGGIGTVIAHEITHAFDTNGAQFGADGSLGNWWTEDDYAAFADKTTAMIALFDELPTMTVSENIADAGGLASALQVVQSLPRGDLAEFFHNWAVIWRIKTTPEYAQLLRTLDVHAPGKLRTNIQLGNLDAFYDTFKISETDGMYIPPERRVTIW